MRKFYLIIIMAGCSTLIFGQEAAVKDIRTISDREVKDDTTHLDGWKKGGIFSLNLAQGGSRNWAAGAEKFSLSTAVYLNLFANKKSGKWSWNNNLDLGYALVNTSSLGVRKNDDKIDFVSRVGYALQPKLDLSGFVNFRSQFADGYEYDYKGKGIRHRISGLFAPAYITVAPGLTWKPTSYFNIFFTPVAARWIIVSNNPYSYVNQGGVFPTGEVETPLATTYGVDPQQKVRIEVGAFVSASFNKEILKNVTYISRLDLYSNYLKSKRAGETGDGTARPENVAVFWTNALNMKVNKWLNVTYQFDLIYDDNIRQFGPDKNSAGTQMRSLLGVGLAAKF